MFGVSKKNMLVMAGIAILTAVLLNKFPEIKAKIGA